MQHKTAVPEWVHQIVDPVTTGLELAGVAVIAVGIVLATFHFLRTWRAGQDKAYERYRANLGRAILLALELMVAADILATVTAPLTFESLGLLGMMVLIRTFLSFSLETEIEGVTPWKRRVVEQNTDKAR